jgi:hypothetical protein
VLEHSKGMLAEAAFLRQLIAGQRRALHYYFMSGVGLYLVGLSLIAVAFLVPRSPITQDLMKDLFGVGGAFIASLSTFPLKEVLNRKEKIGILVALDARLPNVMATRESGDTAHANRLEALLWQVVEKTLLT